MPLREHGTIKMVEPLMDSSASTNLIAQRKITAMKFALMVGCHSLMAATSSPLKQKATIKPMTTVKLSGRLLPATR